MWYPLDQAMKTVTWMRLLAYILIALGIYLLASAAYDEFKGITWKPAMLAGKPYGRAANSGYLYKIAVHREQNPELFRQFMLTHWICALTIAVAGSVLYFKGKPE